MLTYDLDKRGSTPLYDYLYQCIRQDIISGRLQAGERLPSKRTLAQHLSVGIITVANAYAQLVDTFVGNGFEQLFIVYGKRFAPASAIPGNISPLMTTV